MKILSLAIRDTIKSKNSILLFMGIVIAVVFPIIIYMTTNSFAISADKKAAEIYGYFDNILYMAEENIECSEDGKIPDLISNYAETYGIINVYEADQEKNIVLGYIDDKAMTLGSIHLIEGELPENLDEIAVCNSLIYKNDWEDKLGNIVSICGKEYLLVGIINDYSALWDKPVDSSTLFLPNVLLSYENINETYDFIYQQHFLIKNAVNFNESEYLNNPNLISNINRTLNNKSSKYKVPFFVIVLTTCCNLFLNIYIFNFYFEAEQRKMSLLRCLGLTKEKLIGYTFIKILIVLIVSLVIGVFLGNGISLLVVRRFNEILSINNEYTISGIYILNSIFDCLFIMVITVGIVFYKMKKLTPLDIYRKKYETGKRRTNKFFSSKKRLNIWNLSVKEILMNINKSCILVLLTTFSVALFITLSVYMNNYAAQVSDVFGRMSINYDYEFLTDLESADVSYVDAEGKIISIKTIPDVDSVFYLPNYNQIISSEIIDSMREEEGVKNVNEYMEINNLYLCNAPDVSDNEYLSYFLNETELDKTITSKFGINENVLKIQYMGFSENEISDLSKYVIDGKIDIDKIKSGEEVILMVPVYEIADLGDGYYQQNFIVYDQYKNKKNQFKDTYYSVGDELTFVQFYSSDGQLNGYIDKKQVDNYLECNQHKVKIGAIIYERINWFDNATQPPTAYTLIGLNETISNMNMYPEISRVQIYLNNNVSYEQFDDTIRYYQEQLSDFAFRNNAAEMQDYREFKLVIDSVCYLLMGIIIVIMITILLIEDRLTFESRKRYYGLLHINGFDNRHLSFMLIIKAIMLEIMAIILTVPVLVLIARNMYGSINDFIGLINKLNILFIAVYVVGMGMFSTIISLIYLRKKTIIQMIANES